MRRIFSITTLLFMLLGQSVAAKAPVSSTRPDVRPGATAAVVQVLAAVGMAVSPLPRPRPLLAAQPARVFLASAGAAVRASIRPILRPKTPPVRRAVVRSQPSEPEVTGRLGAICGDRSIRGVKLSPIRGRIAGCGVKNPVQVTSVDGVALSTPATLNCDTAKALKKWVKQSLKPNVGRLGGGVKSLRVVAHYACRTRNSQPGAKISEHGRGNAIDIAAINLKNGAVLSVLKGWGDRVQGRILKAVHREACGTFGTVLGPNADRHHRDHLHFDVARHRGGSYCR